MKTKRKYKDEENFDSEDSQIKDDIQTNYVGRDYNKNGYPANGWGTKLNAQINYNRLPSTQQMKTSGDLDKNGAFRGKKYVSAYKKAIQRKKK